MFSEFLKTVNIHGMPKPCLKKVSLTSFSFHPPPQKKKKKKKREGIKTGKFFEKENNFVFEKKKI